MQEKCPVCGKIVSANENKCSECGFTELHKTFISEKDAENWMNSIVKPYKTKYLEKKNQNSLQSLSKSNNTTISNTKTPNKKNNIPFKKILVFFLILLVILGIIFVWITSPCKHKKAFGATCTTGKICKRCKEILGEPLGHEFKKEPTCTEGAECIRCDYYADATGHEWNDATCTKSKTCQLCYDQIGAPLGHTCEDQITCTDGAMCDRCNNMVDPKGHKWIDATCTKPKTCEVCGETSEEPLGHINDSEICSRCDEFIAKELYNDGKVKIYYIGSTWSDSIFLQVKLLIHNGTDDSITVQTRDEHINNYEYDLVFSEFVGPNHEQYATMHITTPTPPSAYGIKSINDIKSLKFKFYFYNYYYKNYETNYIQFKI